MIRDIVIHSCSIPLYKRMCKVGKDSIVILDNLILLNGNKWQGLKYKYQLERLLCEEFRNYRKVSREKVLDVLFCLGKYHED